MPAFLIVTVVFIAASCSGGSSATDESSGEINWFTNLESAKAEANARDTIIMVDVYTDWCGWCKKLDEEVYTNPDVVRFSGTLVNLKVNAEDNAEGTAIAKEHGVSGYPTILFLTADGEEVDRIDGYLEAPSFLAEMQRIASGDGTYLSLKQAYASGNISDDQRISLATMQFQRENWEGAIEPLQPVLDSETIDQGNKRSALMILAQAKIQMGDYAASESNLQKYIELYPQGDEMPVAIYLLGINKMLAGDKVSAKKYLAELQTRYPGETRLIDLAKRAIAQMDSAGS